MEFYRGTFVFDTVCSDGYCLCFIYRTFEFNFLFIPIIISICLLTKKIKQTNTNITIEYILNNQKHTLDDNQVFNNESPISLTWNTNKNAIITLPDKTEKNINKETSFTEVGKYKIKIGKITKEFEIIEESIEQYISFDTSTNTNNNKKLK